MDRLIGLRAMNTLLLSWYHSTVSIAPVVDLGEGQQLIARQLVQRLPNWIETRNSLGRKELAMLAQSESSCSLQTLRESN